MVTEQNDTLRQIAAWLHRRDVASYQMIARTPTGLLDEPMRRLSSAANYSRLSMTAAVALAALGGGRGRRAAAHGLVSVGATSALVNIVAKLATRRSRPARGDLGVPATRHLPMPTSSSFPSGHSAAAFAFATGVGHTWPAAAFPLMGLAGTVAYSRVYTGVHYPGDVAAGSLVGIAVAALTTRLLDHHPDRQAARGAARTTTQLN
ncbi:MAG: phosphatase PAP2 family protein [Actinomycetota bacterium]